MLNVPSAMGYVPINNEVVITDYSEADAIIDSHKVFYNAYLHLLSDSMTLADTLAFASIATQCPAILGPVVYQARSVYDMLLGNKLFYDDDSCIANGISSFYRKAASTELTQEQLYTLYPNPNDGVFAIRQQIPTNDVVEVKLLNTLGVMLAKEKVQFVNGIANFMVNNPLPGLYLFCIANEEHKTVYLKLTIK